MHCVYHTACHRKLHLGRRGGGNVIDEGLIEWKFDGEMWTCRTPLIATLGAWHKGLLAWVACYSAQDPCFESVVVSSISSSCTKYSVHLELKKRPAGTCAVFDAMSLLLRSIPCAIDTPYTCVYAWKSAKYGRRRLNSTFNTCNTEYCNNWWWALESARDTEYAGRSHRRWV
jgi:hypothetical protein